MVKSVDSMAAMFSTLSSKVKWAIGSILAVVVLVAGATTAYALSYRDRALPGVSVAGQSVTGLTREDVISSVKERAEAVTVDFSISGKTVSTSLADAGVSVDALKTADEVFAENSKLLSQIGALFTSKNVEPVLSTTKGKLSAFATELAETTGKAAKNAEVKLSEDGQSFVSTEAASGTLVDCAQVESTIVDNAERLSSGSVTLEPADSSPIVSTEDAASIAEAANAIIALNVTISDGIDAFSASNADKASWVVIAKNEDGTLQAPSIATDKATAWVKATAEASNVVPVNGVNNVNSKGEVLTVAKQGVSGWNTNNADAVASALVAALQSGQAYSGEFHYDEVKPSYESRTVAEGAENLIYQAAEGEKWVDINLSTATVIAYEGARVVGGPYYMVPGAPDTPTVTGTYHVYLKYASQTMRGLNTDGTEYVTPGVPWVTYFTGSYAMHGAPWRSSFGWSGPGGSHGCVNMPVGAAQFIYSWAEIGTTVVSHY